MWGLFLKYSDALSLQVKLYYQAQIFQNFAITDIRSLTSNWGKCLKIPSAIRSIAYILELLFLAPSTSRILEAEKDGDADLYGKDSAQKDPDFLINGI